MTGPKAVPARNSFLKAIALTVVFMIPVLVLVIASGKKADEAGYLFGFYSGPLIFSGIAVGIWAKLSKARWNWLTYILRFVIGAVVIFVLAIIGQAGKKESTRVTDTERQHLVLTDSGVTHTDFGFVVPLPGPRFQPDQDLQRRANQEFEQRGVASQIYTWVFSAPEPRQVVTLMVMKGVGNSEAALRGMARGVNKGARSSGTQVLEDTVEWGQDGHEYRFAATSQGQFIRTRCLSSKTTGLSVSYILCVQTVSADSNALDATRAGARVASWQ